MARRLAILGLALGLSATSAAAQGLPGLGDTLPLTGTGEWPKQQWSYGAPSGNDAAGRVVVHWFCTPKLSGCHDDLARIVTLRESGGVYVVAYINGSARDAKKLDPIRESEGVGRGTLATGAGVAKLFKQLGIAKGPWSIVVDVDGKVKAITTSADLNELDARDKLVKSLVEAIKPYTTSHAGPRGGKVGDKLTFQFQVQLASWLTFSKQTPMEFALTAPKDLRCETTKLEADKLQISGRTLTAKITCTAARGSYQIRGDLRFGYESPNGTTGLGTDGATWKFEITP
jgi:hypothetical protein